MLQKTPVKNRERLSSLVTDKKRGHRAVNLLHWFLIAEAVSRSTTCGEAVVRAKETAEGDEPAQVHLGPLT